MSLMTWYRRQNVHRKIFILFFAITLLSSSAFTLYGFVQSSRAIVNEIDKRLLIAALTMEQLLPQDYLSRAVGPTSISNAEFQRNLLRLNQFLKNVDATYLYALYKVDGKYHFIAAADFALETKYWDVYQQPAPNILLIEKNWRTSISTTDDPEYGMLRSVVIPYTDKNGRRIIIGADIHAHEVEVLKQHAFFHFLVMGGASFLLSILFSYTASRTITLPLTRLSSFTRSLAEHDFSAAIRLDPSLFPDQKKTRAETALLAYDFDLMQRRLEAHIEQLKQTQSARERAESELRIAGQLQATFLPPPLTLESFNHRVELQAMTKTAKQAGGDLYDYFALDDTHLLFAIGDVSGKGMPAAIFMSVVVVLLRSIAKQTSNPAEIIQRVNDDLAERNESCTFVTLFVGILNTETGGIRFANGGHNPPRLITAEGEVIPLEIAPNLVLGVMPEQTFTGEELALMPGDGLFLYSDGITEAFNATDDLYTVGRLDHCLKTLPPQSPVDKLVKTVVDDVAAFSGDGIQADDMTILSLRYWGKRL
nr:SpoIIE family protein phosphatase [uncultured Desulfobulbus sp.]